MRTTLTIDPDVAQLLASEVHRTRKPFKQVVNDTLRRGLSTGGSTRPKAYRVKPHPGGPAAGVDTERLNALADELDDRRLVGKGRPRRAS